MADLAGELRKALIDTFRNEADLGELVSGATDYRETLDLVAETGNLRIRIATVVSEARDNDWLLDLVDAATERRPKSEMLAKLKRLAEVRRALEPKDQFDAVFLRGLPLVDRGPLRDVLRRLDGGAGSPVFVIEGDPRTGKSYSANLINYVKSRRKDFRLASVDLKRIGVYGDVRPSDVGESIARQLRLGDPPPSGQEQDTRWVDQYCEWLEGAMPQETCWIVIDGFGKANLAVATGDLIQQLSKRAFGSLTTLRIVLIDYADRKDLESVVAWPVEHERIEPIPIEVLEVGLRRFFGIVHLERSETAGEQAPPEVLEARVKASVARVLEGIQGEPGPMDALGRAAGEETARISADVASPAAPGGG